MRDRHWDRKLLALALTAALALSATGWGEQENTEKADNTADTGASVVSEESGILEEAPAEDILSLPTAFLSDTDMELADMWAGCDDRALAAVMRKAEMGEKVTIACIGGSITQGTIAGGKRDTEVGERKAYADRFFDWWEQRFPETEFRFVNAGIGGTDSYLGVHRLERDVLDSEPDLVLVEFAVNDGNNSFYKKSYDNLIYNLLTDDAAPAVICLFMAQTSGISAQTSEVLVGYHYSVPMLSYANVISDMIETGRYTAKELSGDGVHPSALGHAVTGEILWNYLNGVYEVRNTRGEPDADAVTEPLTKAVYGRAAVLDSSVITPEEYGDFAEEKSSQQFPNGWGCNGGGGIVFRASFSRLGILYLATTDGKSGQFEVLIDGEPVRTIDADFTGGWGNAIKADEVYASDTVGEHTVELRRSENAMGDIFHLLGLLTSESIKD